MKKESVLGSVFGSVLLLLLGSIFLLFPILSITDVLFVYRLFLGGFMIVSLLQFIIQFKSKEYSAFFLFVISIVLLAVSFLAEFSTPKVLALTLLIWLLFVSLGKVKKADFYHDRKSKIWCILMSLWFLFFICGIFTCLNFGFSNEVSVLGFGYLTFFYGALDLQEYILVYLTRGKIK